MLSDSRSVFAGLKVSTLFFLSVVTRLHTEPPAVHHPVMDAATFDLPNTDSRPRQRAELTGSLILQGEEEYFNINLRGAQS